MKKRMKKISILGVSMTMLLSAGMTTLAANNEITDTRTFTISTKADDTHQYEVYQVLKGDLAGTAEDGSDSENKLSNIKAGQNAKGLDTETAVKNAVKDIDKDITVAVMGCVVNGPGEAREADLGIAGGKGCGILIKKGQIIKKIDEKDILSTLKYELDNWSE